MLGGRRGLVDGALPPLVFIVTYRLLDTSHPGGTALPTALITACVTVLGLGLIRWGQGQPLGRAALGLAGVVVAGVSAAMLGEARAFFLPGIMVDGVYAVGLAGSIAMRRPLVGIAHAKLARLGSAWRSDVALRRRYATATALWALGYTTRAFTQAVFYATDRPNALAGAKLLMGWPLTVLCLLVTLRLVRGPIPRRAQTAPGQGHPAR
jgi:hypothetical protein